MMDFPDDGYWRNTSFAINKISTFFYYYHAVDTSAAGLLVGEGIIRPVYSVAAVTCFIRYIQIWNLQFVNNVCIIKTKISFHQTFRLFQNFLNYLAFQPFDCERTWWRLFQKRVARTNFDIYVLLTFQSFVYEHITMKVVPETKQTQ